MRNFGQLGVPGGRIACDLDVRSERLIRCRSKSLPTRAAPRRTEQLSMRRPKCTLLFGQGMCLPGSSFVACSRSHGG